MFWDDRWDSHQWSVAFHLTPGKATKGGAWVQEKFSIFHIPDAVNIRWEVAWNQITEHDRGWAAQQMVLQILHCWILQLLSWDHSGPWAESTQKRKNKQQDVCPAGGKSALLCECFSWSHQGNWKGAQSWERNTLQTLKFEVRQHCCSKTGLE